MADNGLKVEEAPTEKKKHKSSLKKSDPSPPSESATLRDNGEAPPSRSGSTKKREDGERRESNSQSLTTRRRPSEPAPKGSRRAAAVLGDLDESKLLELQEAFKLFDMDQDGVINSRDLKHTFGTLGNLDVPDDLIQQMLSEASHPLDFDAFVMLLGFKTISLDPEEILLDALGKWDKNKSGLIDEDRIKHDLMTWGDKFTPAEADVALEDAPTFITNDHKYMIDYVKFCKLLCGLRKKTKDVTFEDFKTK